MEENERVITRLRSNVITKNNDLIQKSRYSLTALENKALLYMISKIQPGDDCNTVYQFSCREFRGLMGWSEDAPYGKIKTALSHIANQQFIIDIDEDTEAIVRWFNIVHMNAKQEQIEIKFHEDMFPYLMGMRKGCFFTSYKVENIILMDGKYSMRIYELLKSYQRNNKTWSFEVGTGSQYDIQKRIANSEIDSKTGKTVIKIPKSWQRWSNFSKSVLDKAVEEINALTDIIVSYTAKKCKMDGTPTRNYSLIVFTMREKTSEEKKKTEESIDAVYKIAEHPSVKSDKTKPEHSSENSSTEKPKDSPLSWKDSAYPILSRRLDEKFTESQLDALYKQAIKHKIGQQDNIVFTRNYIGFYYDFITESDVETEFSLYGRLVDLVRNDYKNVGERLYREWEFDRNVAREKEFGIGKGE